MTLAVGSIHRPASGSAGSVIVRSVTATHAFVAPWPQRGRSKVTLRPVALTQDGSGLAGYAATGQRG